MTTSTSMKSLAEDAKKIQPWIAERRRHLHRNPELSFHEVKTSEFVRAQLAEMDMKSSDPVAPGKYGFYTEIRSSANPDRYILLRADMDALPIVEENDVEFKSRTPGVAHLCGHDAHTSMLLGAVKLLKDRAAELPYSVRFVFQHAEEVSPGGAKDFVEAGLTKDVIGCFGLHVSPRLPSGYFGMKAGEAMAMVGGFEVTMRGRGGHGAAPHEAIDPMPAAAAAILALQQIVSRRIAPIEPAVVSVCWINGGSASNVIPDEIRFGGTLRTFVMERGPELCRMVEEIVTATAKSYGCTATVSTGLSYPPVINDARAVAASREAVQALFGERAAVEVPKVMGAEDFAYFANAKPSSFVFLGVLPEGEVFYPLHHAKFLPDEEQLWKGSALLAAMPFVAPKHLLEAAGQVAS